MTVSVVTETQRIQTVVIGGGQAGLSVGYHLLRLGLPYVILDANERVGDAWRQRWDSLRLFTPARFDGLDGMPFPAGPHEFPTKDEMADYLAGYAAHFGLPVRSGLRVDRLWREGDRFIVTAGDQRFEAENVVVAMSNWQSARAPSFATELRPGIRQVDAGRYKHPGQLQPGSVLVVGAGNSGAEIAREVAGAHQTFLSGPDRGHVPFAINGRAARFIMPVLLRIVFHRVLTVNTPVGRKAREKVLSHGMGWIRVKPEDLLAAGVERVPSTAGVQDGYPALEDGRVLRVDNVIWCTGFEPGFDWIESPAVRDGKPVHREGVVQDEPGLYFVGLTFLYAVSSSMIHGVGRDAARIARHIESRVREGRGLGTRVG